MKKMSVLLSLLFLFIIAISGCMEKSTKPAIPPTCSLAASPSSGYAPLVVSFSLNANDSDGYISS